MRNGKNTKLLHKKGNDFILFHFCLRHKVYITLVKKQWYKNAYTQHFIG